MSLQGFGCLLRSALDLESDKGGGGGVLLVVIFLVMLSDGLFNHLQKY